MTDDPKKPRKPGQIDLDLGTLLGSLGEVLGEAVQKLTEAGEAAVDKISETRSEQGPIRSHAGVRIRMGGMAAKTATATPRPVTPRPEAAQSSRELALELIEDGASWIVTAEMPGVLPEEVCLSLQDTRLTVTTIGARHYHGLVTLPAPCPVDRIAQSLVNGILTLRPGAAP